MGTSGHVCGLSKNKPLIFVVHF